MFTLNLKKSVQVSMLIGALAGSVAVHAEAAPVADVMGAIEQTLSTQAQELLVSTKRELVLSLQTQLAESIYDFNSQLSLSADNKDESATSDEYSAK
ncbi:hypothetical protein [Shewanella sp. CG12_big_fil_rev_8_21_14_0_65_47_15]|jgi:hypothetical protein|uniref:hypothetical protein n=1 Tax=Shewanella sp. CG12_big_fil_rev_8_21_14_0_65_47_15 TaxID=1975537 RepID=UPI000CA7C0FA|nr:hypothetical protein [Shewanella sp. CG12_big_fil_rev_8_21_14_0_65_47_15]PIW58760.1 MAG: hypothetical protein COW15_20640 [Shewanella sp. CG12_big_fil_rev_8_21_14_0_65_47_15]